MRFAVAVLIGCVLSLGQNATSSEPERAEACMKKAVSPTDFVQIKPGTRIYFHAVRNENLVLGPALRSDGVVTALMLGPAGKFTPKTQEKRYTVTKSGVLIPKLDPAEEEAREVLRSRKPIFYVKGFKDILIPLNILYAKPQQQKAKEADALARYMEEEKNDASGECEVISEEVKPRKMKKVEKVLVEKKDGRTEVVGGHLAPDKNCNGEITMFVLHSDGVLQRMPPDPYLPTGINLSYTLKDNFLIRPCFFETSEETVMNYVTGKNGDLIPHSRNKLKIRTDEGEFVCFILGECGSLIPVREERKDDHISYSYNGRMIYKGQQFPSVFSNSDFLVINNAKHKLPNKTKGHRIRKRSLYSEEYVVSSPPSNRYYPPVSHSSSIMEELPVSRTGGIVQSLPVQQAVVSRPTQTIVIRQPPPVSPVSPPLRRFSYELPPSSGAPARIAAVAPGGISEEIPSGVPVRSQPRSSYVLSSGPALGPVPLPIPQQIPVQQVHVPIPQREIPIRAPVPEHEIAAIPSTAVVEIPAMPPCKRLELYANDENGDRILLEPEFTEHNDVVLYKLTCKGNLVRFPSCKEPEYGFPIHFKILLEEFVMVPVADIDCEVHVTYILQENGDLVPCEANKNTFKKAPGSLLYFMLGRENVLFPVQQQVDSDGSVTYYYQDNYLLKLSSTANKPLHFSTLGRPLFAYYNGLTVMTVSSKPRLNSCRGSNWKNHFSKMGESESKDIFLAGPGGQLIRVTPFKTKSGSTVIYEMDNNGILYRSPKDKKRCIILKSYIVLKEGILLPSNETTGYMFMASKNGDMFPYLYPEGKLEAPEGESVKYLLCEKGILLPMELEIVNNQICYFFLDVIVYKEKVYTKDDLDSLSDSSFKLHYRNECDEMAKHREAVTTSCSDHFKPFLYEDGSIVFYEKCGNLLKRRPAEVVPKSLSYTMGSFEIQPDGSLFQIRYQNPDTDVINLMLEPNGDLTEDCRNVKKPLFDYYVLDVNGNLIAVTAKKTKKSILFYRNNVKVCRASLPRTNLIEDDEIEGDTKKTPLGYDPLRLMDQPEPHNADHGPMCIPVPLKSASLPQPRPRKGKCGKESCGKKRESEENEKSEENKESCRETVALELEINDEVIEEIRNWASKCDKMLSRREVEESLTEALQGISIAAAPRNGTEAG